LDKDKSSGRAHCRSVWGRRNELILFQEGTVSLAPGARIVCYWDELENLQPLIREAVSNGT
jgi:hypothetical protein